MVGNYVRGMNVCSLLNVGEIITSSKHEDSVRLNNLNLNGSSLYQPKHSNENVLSLNKWAIFLWWLIFINWGVFLKNYLHRSCCQRPGGGRGDTDSAPLPLFPSGNQTGSAGRNMRPLLEDRQGNTGWEMGHWITTEREYTHLMPPHTYKIWVHPCSVQHSEKWWARNDDHYLWPNTALQ